MFARDKYSRAHRQRLTDRERCNSMPVAVTLKAKAEMPLLELKNISKHFGAIHALNDVTLSLEPGQVVGLMGDNGAGKSTLVKIIAGNFRPTHGSLQMEGRELSMHRPIEARQHGIEIVHQDLALCDNLSAAANVFLGREMRQGFGPFKVLDYASMYRRAGQIFAELRSETRPRDLVRQMSGGQRQAVAIARTRIADARIVLMDEPTAAISVRQVAEVLNLIRLLRDRGLAIILISHRMPDVFSVADRVAVLRRGRKVADKPVAGSSPEEVTGLITGAIEHVL
jgi:simple sugar transport system ATP-binding protein